MPAWVINWQMGDILSPHRTGHVPSIAYGALSTHQTDEATAKRFQHRFLSQTWLSETAFLIR